MTDGPRAVALRVIRRVVEEGAYSNLTLRSALDRSELGRDDRALAAELAYGTLRRLRTLDWVVAQRSSRRLERIRPRPLALLRLGAYQLLFTRIPAHAAVSESVSLAGERERGFVNAVLRAIAVDPPPLPVGTDDDSISIRTGLAEWAVRELRTLVGDETEVAAEAFAARAPLSLRVNAARTSADRLEGELRALGLETRRGAIHRDTLLVDAADPVALPGYRDGWFAVQDEASAFVGLAVEAAEGDRVLDACAGPGGKASHLAGLVGRAGVVVAADAAPARARLVAEAARRLGARLLVLAHDARRPALSGTFDRVLVDAPCSGIGAARRRPELLWRPREEDVPESARLQREILLAGSDLLGRGGRLVYSVCTFPLVETDRVCDGLLAARPDLEPARIAGPDGEAPRVRLWPHRHGTDAMFVAAFRRRARSLPGAGRGDR